MLDKILGQKDDIYIYSLGLYGLGLIYLSSYYYGFGIPIIYYLSFNDMLLVALTIIIPVVVITYLFESIVYFLYKRIALKKSDTIMKKNKLLALIIIFLMIFVVLFAVFFRYVVIINPKTYFFVLFCSMSIAGKLALNLDSKRFLLAIIFSFYGLIWGIVSLIGYAKGGNAVQVIKFHYEDKVISTQYYSELTYVGETSSSMFLYSFYTKSTSVFEKSKISHLIYYDKEVNDDWYDSKIDVKDTKSAKTKLATDTTTTFNEWSTSDNRKYIYNVKRSPRELSMLLSKLNDELLLNGFDFELPTSEKSFLPEGVNLDKDPKKLHDIIQSGNYEVEKWWSNPTGFIMLGLEKNYYYIQFIRNTPIK